MALYDQISEMEMFRHFTEKEKTDFSSMSHSFQQYKKGDVIIKQGAMYKSLYLLIKGNVLITKAGYNRAIARLKPGALFGEMSFLTEKPRNTNVIAEEDIMLIRIDKNFFQTMPYEIRDKIKDHLIELLVKRLEEMNDTLIKITL